jgi:predicted O-linked N-acetylglucosamine transferase (SPINDLY family)
MGDTQLQRGVALHRAGDLAGAAREYRAVLAADPRNADALHLLGLIAYRAGELTQARALVEGALALDADNPVFLSNLGNILKDAGDADGAMQRYRRALEIDARQSGAHNNLGTLLLAAGRREEAIECFRAVLAAAPDHARAWFNLGTALAQQGDVADAAHAHRRAVSLQPAFTQAWAELGLALQTLGQDAAAIDALRRRLVLVPASSEAHADLALVLHRSGDLRAARTHYEQALALDDDALPVRCNLHALLQKICDWDAIDAQWPRIAAAIEQGRAGVPPGLLVAQPGATPALQLAAARANATASTSRPPFGHPLPASGEQDGVRDAATAGEGRIRIGYLSADFREHATAYLTAELFELHDRARFEIFLLSYGPDDRSAMRARLQRAADVFVDIRELDDAAAARRIDELGLHVLLDLNGNTDNARMGIAARRPARVQGSWLGFPGTLGSDVYDYLIADAHVVPPGDDRWYAERVIRLPDCYQSNDRQRPRPDAGFTRAAAGLPVEAVVLCCFNQAFKITRAVFAGWMRILAANPNAVLWLLEDNAAATMVLLDAARAQGVSADRIVFAPRRPLAEHLSRYRLADLAVDTFPCTSHTTASDALWMGCPLLTITGDTFAARVATSIVRNAGMASLALESLEAYETALGSLVADPGRLRTVREQLARSLPGAPLFDTPRFARHFEAALAAMAASDGP